MIGDLLACVTWFLQASAIGVTVVGLSLWFAREPRTPEQRYIDQLARRDRHA